MAVDEGMTPEEREELLNAIAGTSKSEIKEPSSDDWVH